MNHNKRTRQFLRFFTFFIGLSTLLISAGSFAAECKALSKGKCEAAANCSWVKGYTTSKGSRVDAYCRAKPSKTSKKSTTSTGKSETKKSTTTSSKTKDSKKTTSKKSASKKEDKKATSGKSPSKSEKTDKKKDKK